MSKLVDYLNHLDKDAAAREAHNSDPTTSMTTFGLSAAEQKVFMSGDKAAIAKSAGIDPDALPLVNVSNIDSTY
jgi:hypothetical protein